MKVRPISYTESGIKKLTRKFYGVFADHNGVIRKLPLFADRKNSKEAARYVERLVSIGEAHEIELRSGRARSCRHC